MAFTASIMWGASLCSPLSKTSAISSTTSSLELMTAKKSSLNEKEEEHEEELMLTKDFQFQKIELDLQMIISCFTVHAKFIALGGHDGSLRLVQHSGELLSGHDYHLHGGMINGISIDDKGKYIGSCSDDGHVSIIKFNNRKYKSWDFERPVTSIALNPLFEKGTETQNFVFGHEKLFLFDCENEPIPLYDESGGDIRVIKWRGSYISMANEKGVFVYNVQTKEGIGFIKFEEENTGIYISTPSLYWMNDSVLIISCGNCIKIAQIDSFKEHTPGMSIVAQYILPNVTVCGTVVLLDTCKVVLGYVKQKDGNTSPYLSVFVLNECLEKQETEKDPILKLMVDRCDYDCTKYYDPSTYHIECHTTDSDKRIFVQTPRSIIVGCKIDANEHLNSLITTRNMQKAIEYAEDNVHLLTEGRLKETGLVYINHLISEGSYKRAAQKCRDLLENPIDWQNVVEKFIEHGVLPVILPYIPKKGDMQLSKDFYQMILNHLLNMPEELCKVIQDWPTDIYNPTFIVDAVTIQLIELESHSDATINGEIYHFKYCLLKVKAKLCEYKGDVSSALKIYLRLADNRSFDLIKEKSLYDLLVENLQSLIDQEAKKTIKLLIEFHKYIPTSQVVQKMKQFPINEGDKKYLLYMYLDALFDVNPVDCGEFHELHLELYAIYNRKKVVTFIQNCNEIDLLKTLEFCTNRKLYEACVYILDCLGDFKTALRVIVTNICDVDKAIAFLKEKNDWELEDYFSSLLKNYTGCSSNMELLDATSKSLKKANDHVVQEYSLLQSNHLDLQREKEHQEEFVTELIRDLSDANQTISTLQATNSEQVEDYTRLKQRFTELERQNNQLKARRLPNYNQVLQQQNTRLQQENAQLQQQITQSDARYTQLEQQYIEWRHQYISLVERNQFLEMHSSSLEVSHNGLEESLQTAVATLLTMEKAWEISHKDITLSDHQLGSGGWGVVRMGEFRGQKVAVKKMHDMINSSPEYMNRLNIEINIMAQLRHPNLLQFIGAVFDHPSGNPMIITEVMDTSLRKAYEEKKLTPDQQPVILSIMRDVAAGLNYLHSLPDPIIHRDVSSANVLLENKATENWKTKLSDFGSARRVDLAFSPAPGAEVYCAPECLQSIMSPNNQAQTTKSDIFSYGILLCEVLTCKFPKRESIQMMLDHIRESSSCLHSLVLKCTGSNPSHRYTIKQVIEQINIHILRYKNNQ